MSSISFKGFLEFVTIRKIYGWLINEEYPEEESFVDLYINGRLYGVYPCNEYHPSLASSVGRNGHVVFSIPTPDEVLAEEAVVVDVRIHGTTTPIPGSPIHTGISRIVIDSALSGMNAAKSALCRTALTKTLNAAYRPSEWSGTGAPEPALRPSDWFDGGRSPAGAYLVHQLYRLNAQNDFHLDGDLADFLAAHGSDFGIGDPALLPVSDADIRRLTEGQEDDSGAFVTRLFRAYSRTCSSEANALPEAARLYQFIQWAIGQVRLPASVLHSRHIDSLNKASSFGAPALLLSELYVEAYRHEEALRSCCDLINERDTFLIALAVTFWLIRWNFDEIFVPDAIRRVLRAPIRHEGRTLPGLAYFYTRLGIPGAEALSLDALLARRKPRAVERLDMQGVNVFGYVASRTALGQNMRASIAALEAMGLPFAVPPMVPTGQSPVERLYPVNLIHFGLIGAPTDMLNHGIDRFRGAYNIGLLMWETSALPRSGLLTMGFLDEIWTPSRYCADVLRQHFDGPIQVVPHAVIMPHPVPLQTAGSSEPDAPFRFYFCFDELSWYSRKNPAAIVDAFARAFPNQQDVELLIKIRPGDRAGPVSSVMPSMSNHRAWQRFLRLSEKDARVRVLISDSGAEEMGRLMAACDCYVSLHRSEGFGYTMAEAMAYGKPVIASRYSANLDYMDDRSAFLVDGCERFMEPDEYIGVTPGARWFEPSIEHAAQMMRLVRYDAGERERRAAAGMRHVTARLTLKAMAQAYSECLEELAFNKHDSHFQI
nr:glycosyltransferase family 4 protein [Azospirillum sp. 412522]